MKYEIYGGKLRYWIFICCFVYKKKNSIQHNETRLTIGFELLRWYVAITIITNKPK